jgi:aryl-alcohol dehydrogenase-like predicted oxidoreductase
MSTLSVSFHTSRSSADECLIRQWDHSTSIPEMMDALDTLVKQGKVLYLGASDMPAWIVSACNEYAK